MKFSLIPFQGLRTEASALTLTTGPSIFSSFKVEAKSPSKGIVWQSKFDNIRLGKNSTDFPSPSTTFKRWTPLSADKISIAAERVIQA